MKKRKKIKYFKETAISILLLIIAFYSIFVIYSIKESQKYYVYAINGKTSKSKECYTNNQITYCKKNNVFIEVDNYYLTN